MIRIVRYDEASAGELLSRVSPLSGAEESVKGILADVKARGDGALRDYTARFDGVKVENFEVPQEEMRAAPGMIDRAFLEVLETAAANIRRFHRNQKREGFVIDGGDGTVLGQKVLPIARAGINVPGGTAAYPATVLMDALPAKIAGVGEVIMVTPPGKDGKIAPEILAAAQIAGVDRVFTVGGAQAIAALAYGTESIPKVDKIVGPGNAYVAEAKKQVFGEVSIDMIVGPSEILIVADGGADPRHAAADLLSQAEHDRMASAVLITDSAELALAVQKELEIRIPALKRAAIARASIENNGKIIVTPDIETALDVSNDLAPEHLELMVNEPFALLDRVKNAGSVFLGGNCPEALGDYLAGPNHTLPTGGTARFSSPLSVDDFVKRTQFTFYTKEAFAKVAPKIALFANREGLTGHAESALVRLENE